MDEVSVCYVAMLEAINYGIACIASSNASTRVGTLRARLMTTKKMSEIGRMCNGARALMEASAKAFATENVHLLFGHRSDIENAMSLYGLFEEQDRVFQSATAVDKWHADGLYVAAMHIYKVQMCLSTEMDRNPAVAAFGGVWRATCNERIGCFGRTYGIANLHVCTPGVVETISAKLLVLSDLASYVRDVSAAVGQPCELVSQSGGVDVFSIKARCGNIRDGHVIVGKRDTGTVGASMRVFDINFSKCDCENYLTKFLRVDVYSSSVDEKQQSESVSG